MMHKKIICVDFDGVIHWYRKGWQGGEIYDEEVPGSIEWIIAMTKRDDIEIAIYSSRSKDDTLLKEMMTWLKKRIRVRQGTNGTNEIFFKLKFPTQKPPAWLTIDDRAICFQGIFPSAEEINNFKPWNK